MFGCILKVMGKTMEIKPTLNKNNARPKWIWHLTLSGMNFLHIFVISEKGKEGGGAVSAQGLQIQEVPESKVGKWETV